MSLNDNCERNIIVKNCPPIIAPVQTHVIEKHIQVNVPHIQPIHTHVVNKVHYNHTVTPQFSTSESTVEENNCGY